MSGYVFAMLITAFCIKEAKENFNYDVRPMGFFYVGVAAVVWLAVLAVPFFLKT